RRSRPSSIALLDPDRVVLEVLGRELEELAVLDAGELVGRPLRDLEAVAPLHLEALLAPVAMAQPHREAAALDVEGLVLLSVEVEGAAVARLQEEQLPAVARVVVDPDLVPPALRLEVDGGAHGGPFLRCGTGHRIASAAHSFRDDRGETLARRSGTHGRRGRK